MTTLYCLSPVLRFSKADWIYFQSLTLVGNPIGTLYTSYQGFYRLVNQVLLLGLRIDIICKYIHIYWETTLLCNHLVIWFWIETTWSWQSYLCSKVRFYVFGVKWIGHDAYTFIHFVLYSVWKWHALFMFSIYCIEETTSVNKTSIILFGVK